MSHQEQSAVGAGPERGAITPNVAALVVVTASGFALGLLPYLLLVGRPGWTLAVAAAVAAMAYFAVRNRTSHAAARPTAGEWVLGAWSAVAHAAAVSLTALVFYAAFYWTIRLGGYLFSADVSATATAWGTGASAVLVGLACLSTPQDAAKSLAGKLYPAMAGTRSPFFALAASPHKWLSIAGLVVVAVALALWFLDPRDAAFSVVLTLVLFYSSFPLADAGSGTKAPAGASRAEAAVRDLFRHAGYDLIDAPVPTGGGGDTLAREVDFLARGEGRLLAVSVKYLTVRQPAAGWETAIPLRSAAGIVLEQFAGVDTSDLPAVTPCLVVIGGAVAESLRAFSAAEGVVLVELPFGVPAPGEPKRQATVDYFAARLKGRTPAGKSGTASVSS